MKVLVISPHQDDEVLGPGGTIRKHVEKGDEVFVVFVAHRIYDHIYDEQKDSLEREHSQKAKSVLGYTEAAYLNLNDERLDACIQDIIIPLEEYLNKVKPEVVYIPFYDDNHQDHRAVFDACRVILRPTAVDFVKKIYMYETPSSTDQSPPIIAFLPNYYVDISGQLAKKLEAMRCYETESREYPHPRSEKALEVLANKRGTEIGFKVAEAFISLRDKWN